MTSFRNIALRNTASPARPASRTNPWRLAALGLLVLAALLVLGGCLAEEGPSGSGATLSFATDIEPLLTAAGCYDCHDVTPLTTTTCSLGCHGGANYTTVPITTLTYAGMVGVSSLTAAGNIVTAGSSATSTLGMVVSGNAQFTTDGGFMIGEMGTSSLNTAAKADIQNWIDGGALP